MSEKRTDVNNLGEFGLIQHLTADVEHQNKSTQIGIGDDAAVLDHSEKKILISKDLLVEGIHFDLMYTPLKHLGYKSVVVNVSDIYAMNGQPEQIVVGIAISNRYSVEAMEELYAGIKEACKVYGVDLVGGDMTSSPKGMTISITVIGSADHEKITQRKGAKKGDLICQTGDLGAAYLGLQLLERERQLYLDDPKMKPNLEEQSYLIGRQLKPEARKDIIKMFEENNFVPTSMIDISDGLASELFHLCSHAGLGAFLEEGSISLHPDTEQMALKFNLDPITTALNGGEDYELLFTVDPGEFHKIKYLPDISVIGEMVDLTEGVTLHTTGGNIHPLQAQGWDHFNQD